MQSYTLINDNSIFKKVFQCFMINREWHGSMMLGNAMQGFAFMPPFLLTYNMVGTNKTSCSIVLGQSMHRSSCAADFTTDLVEVYALCGSLFSM